MSLFAETLPFFFFVVAFVYAMVGFAGGSSYLLVLTLAGFSHTQSAPITLICNLIVSSVGFWNFSRAGHFHLPLILPFLALSIPMAFVGTRIPITKELFFILLGFSLVFAGLRLFFLENRPSDKRLISVSHSWFLGLPVGGVMGFFSGLIGIGGGIFLSPFLILTRLASVREASAAASFFIFVNSLSGLIGKVQNGSLILPEGWWLLVLPAFFGGWIGSSLGSKRVSPVKLERVLASLILFISISLVLKAF